jgi:hypothetical protein
MFVQADEPTQSATRSLMRLIRHPRPRARIASCDRHPEGKRLGHVFGVAVLTVIAIDLGGGAPKDGTYYAKVKQAKIGAKGSKKTCLDRTSPSVKLSL